MAIIFTNMSLYSVNTTHLWHIILKILGRLKDLTAIFPNSTNGFQNIKLQTSLLFFWTQMHYASKCFRAISMGLQSCTIMLIKVLWWPQPLLNICITHDYVFSPFNAITVPSFAHWLLITGFLTRVKARYTIKIFHQNIGQSFLWQSSLIM